MLLTFLLFIKLLSNVLKLTDRCSVVEPVYVFGTLITVIMSLIGFVVKKVDNEVGDLKRIVVDHIAQLASVKAKLEIITGNHEN